MRVTWRDGVASVLVWVAVVAYVVWLVVADTSAAPGVRAMAAAVLVLGVGASATAVVPGFGDLIHGSRVYLVFASLLGLVALAAGAGALVGADTTMLAALVIATVAMWVMASVRHATASSSRAATAHRRRV
jgi:hypothetical protein